MRLVLVRHGHAHAGFTGPIAGAVGCAGLTDLGRAQELIARHDGIGETIRRAERYGAAALSALEGFPEGEFRRAMAEVVEFCINRGR